MFGYRWSLTLAILRFFLWNFTSPLSGLFKKSILALGYLKPAIMIPENSVTGAAMLSTLCKSALTTEIGLNKKKIETHYMQKYNIHIDVFTSLLFFCMFKFISLTNKTLIAYALNVHFDWSINLLIKRKILNKSFK